MGDILKISEVYYGSNRVDEIYEGNDLIFTKNLIQGTAGEHRIVGSNKLNEQISLFTFISFHDQGIRAGEELTLSFRWEVIGDNPSGRFQYQIQGPPWRIVPAQYINVSEANRRGVYFNSARVTQQAIDTRTRILAFRLDYFTGTLLINPSC